jgi:hypothetical protein
MPPRWEIDTMSWLHLGMILLGSLLGVGIGRALADIFLRLLPLLLTAGGVALAYHFTTAVETLPSWFDKGVADFLTDRWYGALCLGGLCGASVALSCFPMTAVLNVRDDLSDRSSEGRDHVLRLEKECLELRLRLETLEKALKPQ